MSAFFLNVLGFFIISFLVVGTVVVITFRDDLKLAFQEYKAERELKKQKRKLM
jgi:hypothetical protein